MDIKGINSIVSGFGELTLSLTNVLNEKTKEVMRDKSIPKEQLNELKNLNLESKLKDLQSQISQGNKDINEILKRAK